jgi:hypothetical protein
VKSSKPAGFKSASIIRTLKKLLVDFTEKDTDIPYDFTKVDEDNPSDLIIRNDILENGIKRRIDSFNLSLMKEEVFLYSFHSNYGYMVSYTEINVFITRMNYIIYFTTLRNGIREFPLFHLKTKRYFESKWTKLRDEKALFENILDNPTIYTHEEVEKIMNDADNLGFDLTELPILSGFDMELLNDLEFTSSSKCSIS